MSNELYIDKIDKPEEVDGVTNYGLRIPFTVQSLEKYGGRKNSIVYTMDQSVSMSKLAIRKDSMIG
jgi:hypothetical protein